MKSHWNKKEAQAFVHKYKAFGEDLALRTYSARLIGQDPTLVLHGGGNTSVKTDLKTLAGDFVRVLCVKGSGWDLDTIEPQGHPAVALEPLWSLRKLDRLSDEDMVNALRINMLDHTGPNPSVETLLHAFLPHKFIDHTHADAVLSLIDQPGGEKRVRDWTGDRMGFVPYIMPGFSLSKLAAQVYEQNPRVEGLILYKHGIFTFGDTAQESYERMIYWVDSAERRLKKSRAAVLTVSKPFVPSPGVSVGIAANLIRSVCRLDQKGSKEADPIKRMIVRFRSNPAILRFVNSREAARLSQIGPATPDHVIRTKPKPLYLPMGAAANEAALKKALESGLKRFERAYQNYFVTQTRRKKVQKVPLDSLPRIVIVPSVGLFALGADAKNADIGLDVYEHTIQVIEGASKTGRYEALNDSDLFDMEYWSLEQAKLGKSAEKPFSRKIVWVSGAASGIGLATAAAFARSGAHVFMTDINEELLRQSVSSLRMKSQIAWQRCDATMERDVLRSFDLCSATFGGVDIVVSNAGVAPTSDMAACDERLLRKSFEINFFAHQNVAKAAAAIFNRQRLGGALLFNASKSAFNPGPGFGPYALPKSAVIALMKQYAIELGKIGVRCNAVNADRVRTRLFDEGLLEKRAQARGLSVTDYLSGNLLQEEVYAEDVAQCFVFLVQMRKTSGATVPVDGGNAAAFPR